MRSERSIRTAELRNPMSSCPALCRASPSFLVARLGWPGQAWTSPAMTTFAQSFPLNVAFAQQTPSRPGARLHARFEGDSMKQFVLTGALLGASVVSALAADLSV